MKLCELIKTGWPEKKDIYNYENREWNDCLAAIEPIKEMEVGVDEIKIEKEMDGAACAYRNYEIMTNSQNLNESEKKSMKKLTYFGFIAQALANNVEKILIVKKER